MNIFTKHPTEVGESYLRHGFTAMRYAFTCLLLFVIAFIHAIFPFMFERTASNCVKEAVLSHARSSSETISEDRKDGSTHRARMLCGSTAD